MTIVVLFKIVIKISQISCFPIDRLEISLLLLPPRVQRYDKTVEEALNQYLCLGWGKRKKRRKGTDEKFKCFSKDGK